MSQVRVVTGVDERGRPKSEWRPVGDGTVVTPAYGHMQPAYDGTTIERRRATPEELAAAKAREEEPSHLVAPTMAKPPTVVVSTISQASRLRGGAVTGEMTRKAPAARTAASYRPKPSPEEETAVSEGPADIPTIVPEATPDADAGFLALAEAAREVAYADAAAKAAQGALQIARDRLQAALTGVGLGSSTGGRAKHASDHPEADTYRGGPVRSRSGEGQRPGQASERDRRASLVMEAMGRLGDDQGAVAAELGMKQNAVAQVVKFARKREATQA